MRKTIPLLLILSFHLSGCMPERSTSPPPPPPDENKSPALCQTVQPKKTPSSKHALLIGIEKYNHPKISDLGGAINDVKLMQGVLRTQFDFQNDDFITLLNEQATHTCIENAFKTLIKRIQPNDFVYIHYAGHGSQTPDLNGDERSGQDQTWVSFGTRQPGRKNEINEINEIDNYEVLDDEINAWLAAIYAKTAQVIFVSDSCHSATVARGNAPVSRGLEPDERSHPLGRRAYTQLNEYHGIHIGAARDKEFAAETAGDDGKFYGLFTWHWAKALQQAQVGDTWNQVFKRAQTPVFSIRGEAQRPQLEGERHRQVFGGHLTPPVATVAVSSVKGERIKIQAGATAGVTVGSIYRLQSENRARLEITKVGTFESEAKTTVVGAFKVGDLVVEKSHAYRFDPIKVYLSADYPKDRPLLQAIRAAFQGTSELPGYVLTNKPEQTDLRLQLLRPKRGRDGQAIFEKDNDALPKSFPNQAPELWILTPDQHLLHKKLQIKFDDPSKGVELVKYNLNHLARVREVKALQRRYRGATLPVTVQADILTPCPTGGDCMQVHDLGLYDKKSTFRLQEIGKRRLDEMLSLTLHNQSRRDYYCYLINISPDGTIYAIYPDPEERMEYARVKAGEKRELIDDVVLILKNVGEQTLKLIATTRPMDVSLLQKEGFKGRTEDDLNPLERLLVSAAHGARAVLLRLSNDQWFTRQVTFEVK
ncbi:hypothetical protein PN36_18255 [Candidatus Thiomargarita nelsonii]|uniref:Peptidase C14 caspase domain-containing protein n=1 Tax=Candidatus Thiomargarita nelsonii TaxID=1003181 RepID=A0A4E0QQ63_9GAMM|nr:hypothetical protein PN36_18255 [Candidatus Thiomargarita nelsonii]